MMAAASSDFQRPLALLLANHRVEGIVFERCGLAASLPWGYFFSVVQVGQNVQQVRSW